MSSNYRSYLGTSRECLYSELGLESLSSRRWCRKLCAIYKLLSTQCPKYLFDIIPSSERFYDTRKKQRPFFNCRTDCFKYSFFPNSLSEWSQLAPEIQNSESIVVFKSKLLSFIRPSKRSIFNVNDPEGVKYLTRLRLRFSHLNKHKFRHGFLDTLNPLCNCSLKTMNIFSWAASILKMLEGPSSSTYQVSVHLLKICPVI